jgi:hypothetical protein
MSTKEKTSPFDGKDYPVGVGGIASWVGSTNKKGEKTDVSTFKLLVPTYGS